jgi:Fe-S-cluster-containing dehydrogenase component
MKDAGRRCFLKCASLGVLGLAAKEILEPVAAGALDAAAAPKGRRWGMTIDLAACQKENGCSACITACHRAHNVPAIPEPRHEVKWLWREKFRDAFPDQEPDHVAEALTGGPVLVLCNHCDNPPCARVCPTEATWRRADGVVMMDWHRCIGCRYCVAACPYGSRSFNFVDPKPHLASVEPSFPARAKGVVEKCTLCSERLDRGKLPACVEACPDKALAFGDLNDPASPVRQALRTRYALRRRPGLGTHPAVYYLV